MDFRRLRHAQALKEEGNYVKAATRLHISQPALSQSISRLEQDVGLRLFDRNRSGAQLTAVGKTFMARAEELLRYARGMEQEMALIRGGVAGSVAFGIGPMPTACFLKDLLHHIVTKHPDLEIHAEVNRGDELLDHLISERFEFFIASQNYVIDSPLLAVRPLTRLRLAIFGRADHPLASRTRLKAADLQPYPLLSPSVPATSAGVWANMLGFRKKGRNTGAVYCDDFYVLKELALDSDALLIAPRSAVARERAEGRLVELLAINAAKFKLSFVVVTLNNRTLSPLAELVIAKFVGLAARVDRQP